MNTTHTFAPRNDAHADALTSLLDDGTAYLGPVDASRPGRPPVWMLYHPDHPGIPLTRGHRTPQDAVDAITQYLKPAGKWPQILWLPPPADHFAA